MSRTACFGPCPVYDLSISGSGEVVFFGHQYVAALGEQHAAIDPRTVYELLREFYAADFFRMRSNYSFPHDISLDAETSIVSEVWGVTHDRPTKTVRLRIGAWEKTFVDVHGAPEVLWDLQKEIDRAADVGRWTGRMP